MADRTRLRLPIVGITLGVDNTQATPKLHPSCDELDEKILQALESQPTMSQSSLASLLDKNINVIKTRVSKLKRLNLLAREGSSQNGKWIVKI